MSVASLLLRVVLMISLLLNGLNAAMAAGYPASAAQAATAVAEPPCHSQADAATADGAPEATHRQAQAPPDDGHCKLKECVRACAQQPALATEALVLLPAEYAGMGLLAAHAPGHPTPALPRIQRPPIG